MNAPVPHGARRHAAVEAPPSGGGWSDAWSPTTSVQSTGTTDDASAPNGQSRHQPVSPGPRQPYERGLPGWGALLVLLVIAGIGGVIDAINGAQVRGGFNYGIVIASIVAILLVRRAAMFPIVIAPPIVYSAASAAMLYVRSSGLHNRRVLFDAAANWLVYGFPAIAAATAAVLIIAGIRLIVRR
ncbi:MAG: hypothetical protein JWO57_4454 [Pseudonocardiales bacterium]|nr:hypothetical protein [Pseudonocardiales bacterium]